MKPAVLPALAFAVAALIPNAAPGATPVDRAEAMKWWDACAAWGREFRTGKNTTFEAALLDRLNAAKLINSLDRAHVGDRSVVVGMTECGVFAAKGRPQSLNQTTYAFGRRAQYVYGNRLYVYVDDLNNASVGVVTAIQH